MNRNEPRFGGPFLVPAVLYQSPAKTSSVVLTRFQGQTQLCGVYVHRRDDTDPPYRGPQALTFFVQKYMFSGLTRGAGK